MHTLSRPSSSTLSLPFRVGSVRSAARIPYVSPYSTRHRVAPSPSRSSAFSTHSALRNGQLADASPTQAQPGSEGEWAMNPSAHGEAASNFLDAAAESVARAVEAGAPSPPPEPHGAPYIPSDTSPDSTPTPSLNMDRADVSRYGVPTDQATMRYPIAESKMNSSSRTVFVRTSDGIRSMRDALALLRGVERRYGRVRAYKFIRDTELSEAYVPYFYVEFDSQEVFDRLPRSEAITVEVPERKHEPSAGYGLAELTGFMLAVVDENGVPVEGAYVPTGRRDTVQVELRVEKSNTPLRKYDNSPWNQKVARSDLQYGPSVEQLVARFAQYGAARAALAHSFIDWSGFATSTSASVGQSQSQSPSPDASSPSPSTPASPDANPTTAAPPRPSSVEMKRAIDKWMGYTGRASREPQAIIKQLAAAAVRSRAAQEETDRNAVLGFAQSGAGAAAAPGSLSAPRAGPTSAQAKAQMERARMERIRMNMASGLPEDASETQEEERAWGGGGAEAEALAEWGVRSSEIVLPSTTRLADAASAASAARRARAAEDAAAKTPAASTLQQNKVGDAAAAAAEKKRVEMLAKVQARRKGQAKEKKEKEKKAKKAGEAATNEGFRARLMNVLDRWF